MPKNYAGMNKEQLHRAIERAKGAEELDAIWKEVEPAGYAREGMVFAAILERRQTLGLVLADEDAALLETTRAARERGRNLPPIGGATGGR